MRPFYTTITGVFLLLFLQPAAALAQDYQDPDSAVTPDIAAEQDEPVDPEAIHIQSITSEEAARIDQEGLQHITFYGPEEKYYQSESRKFLVDFHSTDLQIKNVDTVKLNISGKQFTLPRLSPFIVSGLTPGQVSIQVKLVDNAGNTIGFPSGASGKLSFKYLEKKPLFTNDAVVLGILLCILAFIFITSSSSNPRWQKFYKYVPSLLLCYFIPSIFNSLGIISGDSSKLYFVASRYLLPASLVLLTLSIDLKGILRLGPKALIMFLAGTLGIVVGGPIAIMLIGLVSPETVGGAGPDAVWRGLATVAGSWIGGGANQTAMKEIFNVGDTLFSAMITVDVIVANVWMAFLLYGAGISKSLDKVLKADSSAITEVREKIENYQFSIAKMPTLTDMVTIVAVGFGATAVSHWGADILAPWLYSINPELEKFSLTSGFFWLIVIATTLGLFLSFTRTRKLEGAGASKMGSLLLYVLVATIGMKMDIMAIFSNPGLFAVGFVWMLVHVTILLSVAFFIRAPFFFVAVGSQANVGGAASAPIVASAFHPSLAPVGVLLAVLGYALGTYAAYGCALLMQVVAGGI